MVKFSLSTLTILSLLISCLSFNVDDVDFENIEITFSEDGRNAELPFFFLQVFETDGDLPTSSYQNIEYAMNQYLLAELNAKFAPYNLINQVSSRVYTDDAVDLDQNLRHLLPEHKRGQPSLHERLEWEEMHGSLETGYDEKKFLRGRRNVQSITGSEMLMKINVTFDRSPSPTNADVTRATKTIMKDLDYLVNNITAIPDPELAKVYMAVRLEMNTPKPELQPSSQPSQTPSLETDKPSIYTEKPSTHTSKPSSTPTWADISISPSQVRFDETSSPTTHTSKPSSTPTWADISISPSQVPFDETSSPTTHTSKPSSTPTWADISISPSLVPFDETSSPTTHTSKPSSTPTWADISISPSQVSFHETSSPTKAGSSIIGRPSVETPSWVSPNSPSVMPILYPSIQQPSDVIKPSRSQSLLPSSHSYKSSVPSSLGSNNPTIYSIPNPEAPKSTVPLSRPSVLSSGSSSPSIVQVETPGIEDNDSKPKDGTNEDEHSNTMIIGAVIGSAAAAAIIVAALLLVRRRKREDDEIIPTGPSPVSVRNRDDDQGNKMRVNVPASPMDRSTTDSVFSGLTDILADTGSPRVRSTKSLSSATTVRATNLASSPYNIRSPISMTNASVLFAFSEENEEDISDSDAEKDDKVKRSPDTLGKTPLISNKAIKSSNAELQALDESPIKNMELSIVEEEEDANKSPQMSSRRPSTSTNLKKTELVPFTSPQISVLSADGAFPTERNSRHHAGNGTIDGTSEYQQAMHPLNYSFKSDTYDDDSSAASEDGDNNPRRFVFASDEKASEKIPLFSPRSERSKASSVSGLSTPGSKNSTNSEVSASRQLINDLVWLEKKIADARKVSSRSQVPMSPMSLGDIENTDSLSYASKDALVSPSSRGDTTTIDSNGIMQSIVCRDCFAPPGKLQIVIHSTKDGPAVHSVKPGSSLEGHIFPGDLIIAVDNVDTRTFKAEEVMKMMASKNGFERKITVLHYER
jgi:PDZ domain